MKSNEAIQFFRRVLFKILYSKNSYNFDIRYNIKNTDQFFTVFVSWNSEDEDKKDFWFIKNEIFNSKNMATFSSIFYHIIKSDIY